METQLPKGRLGFLLLCIRDCAFGWDLEGNLNLQTWGCHEPGQHLRVEVHPLLWGGDLPAPPEGPRPRITDPAMATRGQPRILSEIERPSRSKVSSPSNANGECPDSTPTQREP